MTENCEIDIDLLDALKAEVKNNNLPLQIQTGITYRSKCGNLVMPVQIDYPDDFDLNAVLCEVINKTYKLE